MKLLENNITHGPRSWLLKLVTGELLPKRFLLLGALGLLLLIVGNIYDSSLHKTKVEIPNEKDKKPSIQVNTYEEAEAAKLSSLLSQIKGAGAVSVCIAYETDGIKEHAKNIIKESKIIQEKDNTGGIRTTTEVKENQQILLSKENGSDHPITVSESKPAIKGIMVVADGASDSMIKAQLMRAIEGGMGVPAYKITVLPQKK